MAGNITYVLIGGIITFALVLATAMIPILNQKKLAKIPMKYHVWLARATILFAMLHIAFAVLTFLG